MVVAGRTTTGPGLMLAEYATLRADGEAIRVGANAWFGRRATVHIADSVYAAVMGDELVMLFVGARRWCCAACGNRARAARHYARTRAASGSRPSHAPRAAMRIRLRRSGLGSSAKDSTRVSRAA